MAWVTPSTISTGCLVSAARWNQDIVSNAQYLKGQSGSVTIEDGAVFSGSVSSPCLVGQNQVAIIGAAGNKRLLLGNTGGGASPLIIQGTNGQLYIGLGTSFTGDGSTLTTKVYIAACQMVVGASAIDTKMTQGVAINQGAADDEIVALKSSDVAHGLTTFAETDTYGLFKKVGAAAGGLNVTGIEDGGTAGIDALLLTGLAISTDTTKGTGAWGAVTAQGLKKSDTTSGCLAANENIFTIRNQALTRFIFDADGDLHADAAVTASAYDAHNDIGLVRALELHRAPTSVVKDVFDEWVRYSRQDLQRLGIATFNDQPGEDGSVFINYTGLTRLHSGALWQLHKRMVTLERATGLLLAVLDAPTRLGGWLARTGRRLLQRKDGTP